MALPAAHGQEHADRHEDKADGPLQSDSESRANVEHHCKCKKGDALKFVHRSSFRHNARAHPRGGEAAASRCSALLGLVAARYPPITIQSDRKIVGQAISLSKDVAESETFRL
jgi:hypothetical protein